MGATAFLLCVLQCPEHILSVKQDDSSDLSSKKVNIHLVMPFRKMKAHFHSSVAEVMGWLSRVTFTVGPASGRHSIGSVRTICGVCAEAQLYPI